VLLLAASFASDATIRGVLDWLADDGQYESFTARLANKVRLVCLTGALASLGLAALALVWRERLAVAVAKAAGRIGADTRWVVVRCRAVQLSRLEWFVLVFATTLAVVLRLIHLNQPMRYDETVTFLEYARHKWSVPLATYRAPNNHVFHSLLVHFAYKLFGDAPWSLRLPAFISGVLIVPLTFFTAKRFYGSWAAMLSAGLAASSFFLVLYSTNARGYTLQACLFLAALLLAEGVRRHANVVLWGLLVAVMMLGFWILPTMLYPCAIIFAWLSVAWMRQRVSPAYGSRFGVYLVAALLATAIGAGLLYLPIVANVGLDAIVSNGTVSPLEWDRFVQRLPGLFPAISSSWHRDLPPLFPLVLVVGAVAAVFLSREEPYPSVLAILAISVPLAMISIQRVVPFTRVFLFLAPLYFVVASHGLCLILRRLVPERTAGVLILSLVFAIPLWQSATMVAHGSVLRSGETGAMCDARRLCVDLNKHLGSEDVVLARTPANDLMMYYFGRLGMSVDPLLRGKDGDRLRLVGADARCFCVVGNRQRTLDELLSKHPEATAVFDRNSTEVILDYDTATVYRLARRPPQLEIQPPASNTLEQHEVP
jgi:hypothetical protein